MVKPTVVEPFTGEAEVFPVQSQRGTWCIILPSDPSALVLQNTKQKILGENFRVCPDRFIIDFTETRLIDTQFVDEMLRLIKIFEVLGARAAVCGISPTLGASISMLELLPTHISAFSSLDRAIKELKNSDSDTLL